MNRDQLQHSAKGTTWSKKDHKYIRKEGDKYIYDERTTNVGKKFGSQVPSSTKMKAMIAANKGLQVLKKIGIAESNKQKAKEIEKINKKTAEKLATSDWERLKKKRSRSFSRASRSTLSGMG